MSTVSIRWRGGALAFASAHGDVVRVAPRPLDASCWDPEELLAAASAASFVLAVVDEAEQRDVPLLDAVAKAATRAGGVHIDASFETLPGFEPALRDLAQAHAKQPLGTPADVRVRVHTAEATATRRATASLV